ncbi:MULTISPECIES: hypothetical protein [Streptomyces]|uniref:Uncharacterized protein n=2 Tax=Streptomyces rimosus subsp. rimosus TaxID=132474 RepID=L8EY89_STRR1|nr:MULTISPECIES: hypothetical protein [Streptomyces]KOG84181.1 hypothetical protein ADK78_00905 [Kitasatospora aureofaciens]MYT44898.1 hypothetical protein [Streptomyces sp. SID5471]KOT91926.1 hypothetical protein ADK48_00270 [Streptomyces rimosus subsp. rimosus]QDA07228.1 hypothetical protein CTZ40_29245 [Streptomyces rimosus]QGY70383.1 hypothetical protein V519_034945 [Streptomyces rimosus R6-500]
MTPTQQPRHPVPDHIPDHLHEAFATTAGRAVPEHSPFQLGDAVQRHGFPGNLPGHAQTGFRGWVVATVGATILTGITTTGEEWWEYWGKLSPDGQPVDPGGWCTCCRDARRALNARQRATSGEQLGLFGEVAS